MTPLKIALIGGPASGKTSYGKELASEYKIPYLRIQDVIVDYFKQKDLLNAELLEIKKPTKKDEDGNEVEDEDAEEDEEITAKRESINEKLTKIDEVGKMVTENGRYSDQALVQMYRYKMNQKACQNQGFILDGYPKTVQQALLLFVAKNEDEEEEEEEDEESKVPKDYQAHSSFLPEYLVVLDFEKDVLSERLMDLAEDETQGSHNTQEEFERRYAAWMGNNDAKNGVVSFIEGLITKGEEHGGHQVLTKIFKDGSLSHDEQFQKIKDFVGDAHNYGLTQEEIEELEAQRQSAIDAENLKNQEALTLKAKREELERITEQKRKLEEEQRLATIINEEREMLKVNSAPLRQYLMENVIPYLTQALIEVCQLKPDDPIDYIANYLFKVNPVDSEDLK